jgi:crotonobetainyl-CoA:carnitine CoA-transferase CaiB-like acyl-CoA transferase
MRLCADADAVVENYRGGVMDRLGLGYETLHERFPRLVYATIRGFGDWRTGKSPYTDWPAYDVVAQAFGGVMAITGPDKDTPMKVGPGIGDLMPATMCAVGIVSAILRAHKTGRGQFVDVGMVDAILSMCERIVHQHSFTGGVPVPEGNHHPLLCPFGMFPAKDGHVTIAAHADTHWPILCRLIGKPEMGTDPRLANVQDRRAHQDEIIAAVSAFTRQRTKQELLAHLGGQVPFAPVNDVRDVFANPHFAARDMVVSVPHPGLDHDMKVAGVAIKMSETPGRVRHRAPLLGEHTDQYLTSLGLSGAEIARLRAGKIVA